MMWMKKLIYHRVGVVNTNKGGRFAQRGMRRVGVLGASGLPRVLEYSVHGEKCPDSQGQRLSEPAHVPTQLDVSRT